MAEGPSARPSRVNLTRGLPVGGAGAGVGAVAGACALPGTCATAGTASAMASASR